MNQEIQNQKMSQVLARYWSDAAFKATLLADPVAALQSLGIDVPAGVQLRILEDSGQVRHLVIPCPPAGLSDAQLDAVAGGWRVSQEVTDAVTQSNVKHLGGAPAPAPHYIFNPPISWFR